MADAFAGAFKRYWAVITTVASVMLFIGGAIYTVTSKIESRIEIMQSSLAETRADVRELKAAVDGNFQRIEEFRQATESGRYTNRDAEKDLGRLMDRIDTMQAEINGMRNKDRWWRQTQQQRR